MYFVFILLLSFIYSDIESKGDLALRSKKIELQLGSEKSDYDMSKKVINLETGKAYRLEISSLGFKEYEFEAEDFFKNIWIRKVEINGIEIVVPTLLEIEFEREGEIEINFVPIRTGVFPFEIEGLQSKGMTGEFVIE
tara:strand:+ start:157 stop:570 length:414 start_codon:yes stop_codon:yes gene_type:complete